VDLVVPQGVIGVKGNDLRHGMTVVARHGWDWLLGGS
jgi:hypothetical protein